MVLRWYGLKLDLLVTTLSAIVFGLLKRQGKVYTEIVPDCSKAKLQGIIRGHVEPVTVIRFNHRRDNLYLELLKLL